MSEHCFIFLFYTKTVNQVVYVAYVWTLFYFLVLHKDSKSSCVCSSYVWTLFYFLDLHKDSKSSCVCSICLNIVLFSWSTQRQYIKLCMYNMSEHCFIFLFYTKTVNQVVYVAYVWTLFYFLVLHKDSKSSCVCSICLNIVLFLCM